MLASRAADRDDDIVMRMMRVISVADDGHVHDNETMMTSPLVTIVVVQMIRRRETETRAATTTVAKLRRKMVFVMLMIRHAEHGDSSEAEPCQASRADRHRCVPRSAGDRKAFNF